MGEVIGFIIVGIIGFIVGGIYGLTDIHSWSPDCWYGMMAAWVSLLGGVVCL